MKLRASSHKPHSSFGSKVALAAPPCLVNSWRSVLGESYAGKFVPAIGYYILKKNDELMMPDHDHDQSQILINLGLINERQRIELEWHQQEAIRLAKMRHWREATNARHQVVDMLHYMTRLPTLLNVQHEECEIHVGIVGEEEHGFVVPGAVWKVNGDELFGYVQKWGSLSHVVVSRAGHLVPADQPLNSQAMIEGWILETGLFSNVQSWFP
ncbi:unnamed protein product [Prunus armeniaca]|uniref:Uncharacterized protein n=1 Tax=Prunus armeniaca TaxID=36596 RepID=A0A6J5WBU0_PRUAR|nr:unnamed protein product [Prunus armeniaca]